MPCFKLDVITLGCLVLLALPAVSDADTPKHVTIEISRKYGSLESYPITFVKPLRVSQAIGSINGLAKPTYASGVVVLRIGRNADDRNSLFVDWERVFTGEDRTTDYLLEDGDIVAIFDFAIVPCSTSCARVFAPVERLKGLARGWWGCEAYVRASVSVLRSWTRLTQMTHLRLVCE